jgi:hypothetical protein
VGMVVAVTGTVAENGTTGTATQLVYESLLRGAVDSVTAPGTLRLLGQVVTLNETTVFAGALSFADLSAGDHLQISGFRQPDGSLQASWVSRESSVGGPQLTGLISAVGSTTPVSTITVGGITLNVASAELIGVTRATLAQGQLVRATLQAAPAASAAVATQLRLIDTRTQDALIKQQRQGVVAQWNATTNRFTLDGQPVQLSSSTVYEDDATVADVANNTRVEVTGMLASDGVLRATKLRLLANVPSGYVRGRVTAVDPTASSFRVLGSALAPNSTGVEVRLRNNTVLSDNVGSAGAALTLAQLSVGDEVLVLGRADGTRIDADLIARQPLTALGRGVAGPVQNVSGTNFTLLGVNVNTSGATYRDALGANLTQTEFFAALRSNDLIRAEGSFAVGGINATVVRRVR